MKFFSSLKRSANLKGSLLLLLTATIWGVAFVAQSVGMDYVGPFTFNAIRSLIGAAVLVPCLFFLRLLQGRRTDDNRKYAVTDENRRYADTDENRKGAGTDEKRKDAGTDEKRKDAGTDKSSRRPKTSGSDAADTKTLLKGGLCCGIVLCIASNLQQIGIFYTTVGKAGFITAMYIVLVPILGIFLGRRTGWKIWVSVLLAVAGLYLLCMTGTLQLGRGDALVLLCAFAFALQIMAVDYFAPKTEGVKLACLEFQVCGILSSAAMLIFEKPVWAQIRAAGVPILYAGIMSSGVAYTLQIIAQKDMDPTVASLIMSLESVISALAGWAILHQTMGVREICGCVVMFAAIILAQLPDRHEPAGLRRYTGKQ